jgi:L-asparaginase / beta-aspartyl-peptidase
MDRITMAVHGGAYDIPLDAREAHRRGCEVAVAAGYDVLARGGTAVDAVEAAVIVLEDDPTFDAGRGSFLNEDGMVELDAGIMDGRDLDAGACASVLEVRNPIALARMLLESDHVLLVGPGADRWAREHGVAVCDQDWLVTERERERWSSAQLGPIAACRWFATGGAFALDRDGHLAAATSTGGMPSKPRGRVGDAPIVGAGLYADDAHGAVSVTGWGEGFIRLVWAHRAALLAGEHGAEEGAVRALAVLDRLDARGGLVVLDPDGTASCRWNTPAMAFAIVGSDRSLTSGPA